MKFEEYIKTIKKNGLLATTIEAPEDEKLEFNGEQFETKDAPLAVFELTNISFLLPNGQYQVIEKDLNTGEWRLGHRK